MLRDYSRKVQIKLIKLMQTYIFQKVIHSLFDSIQNNVEQPTEWNSDYP